MMPDKNKIIGELMTKEKYQFVDPKLLAAIVIDTLEMVGEVTVERRKNHFQRVAFVRI